MGLCILTSLCLKILTTMTRELIPTFQGENNVTKITSDNGAISYLTASKTFQDEAYERGAVTLNTVENERKHVLFLFNSEGAEVSRYYLAKKLQGMKPSDIAAKKHNLCIFKSWNATPGAEGWVPCVGYTEQENLAASAVAF